MTRTYDTINVLSGVSGLSPDAIKDIFVQVKENHARLMGCKLPHDFVPHEKYHPEKPNSLVRTHICTKCRGTLVTPEARWYIQGLKDAGT